MKEAAVERAHFDAGRVRRLEKLCLKLSDQTNYGCGEFRATREDLKISRSSILSNTYAAQLATGVTRSVAAAAKSDFGNYLDVALSPAVIVAKCYMCVLG